MNFLEQIAAEWYESQGYFVRTNTKANRRPNGGWNNELDVLAYDPAKRHLVHIETSWDADTWDQRQERYTTRKFVFSHQQYEALIGSSLASVQRRAVVGTSQAPPVSSWGDGIEVCTVPQFIREIADGLRPRHPLRDIIPETSPCLRSMQFILAYERNA